MPYKQIKNVQHFQLQTTLLLKFNRNRYFFIDCRWRLHNLVYIPQHWISMEVLCWIKPQINSLLSIVCSICENICLKNIWLPGDIAKKLKVYLISIRLIRGKLSYFILKLELVYTFMIQISNQEKKKVKGCLHNRPGQCLQNHLALVWFACLFVQIKTSGLKQNQLLQEATETQN